MFRKSSPPPVTPAAPQPVERVTSVLGPGINWQGDLQGSGGVRIEGTFEGGIVLRGLVVVGETGRVTCENLRANTVIVAGTVNGCISAEKLEIRSTGRVWGDVVVVALATEEGAFLRGQVRMEEQIEVNPDVTFDPNLPTLPTPNPKNPPPNLATNPNDTTKQQGE